MANHKKNLKLVREHLDADEKVHASVFGAYETKILGKDSVRNGILVATSKRLVFYAKKLGGHDFESFPYSKISSLESGKGMMGGTLGFYASGNKVKMKWISDGDVPRLIEVVRTKMDADSTPSAAPAPVPHSAPASEDFVGMIEKLAALNAAGHLTDEEFGAKKAEILARI